MKNISATETRFHAFLKIITHINFLRRCFMHYYLDFNGYRLSLVGSVITIFNCEGKKVRQYFYSSHNIAKRVFMSLCQTWCLFARSFFYRAIAETSARSKRMYEVNLSDEICEYISAEDFNKLVSVPSITEDDVVFIRG